MSSKKPQTLDSVFQDGRETDAVILVMGAIGAGKSSFINSVLGEDRTKVGHSVAPTTVSIAPVVCDPIRNFPKLAGRRLVLVDTPGFDDTYAGDEDILRRIATWLEASYYKKKAVLSGIIYLHDISQNRIPATTYRNLQRFQRLWGDTVFGKAVLATTKWRKLQAVHAEGRENELKNGHWRAAVEKGSQIRRFMGDSPSGWGVLNVFLACASDNRNRPVTELGLLIQTELTRGRKFIPETKAGKGLRYTLEEVISVGREIIALQKEVAEKGEGEAQRRLEEKQREMNKLVGDIQALKICIPQGVRKFLGLTPSEVGVAP